jgi:glycerol uptake facilitator-like aquaporin
MHLECVCSPGWTARLWCVAAGAAERLDAKGASRVGCAPAKMSPFLAEFLGTTLLVLFGDGVVANVLLSRSKGQNGGWIVISAGWACGVTIAVYAVNALSGAHLNPAVTIALASIGKFEWSRVPGYISRRPAARLSAACSCG